MSSPKVIAVNITSGPAVDVNLVDIGGLTIPASNQVDLTSKPPAGEYYSLTELQSSSDLIDAINNDEILINDGLRNLDKTESINYLTTTSSVNENAGNIKENFTAVVDPTVNDDNLCGYSVGSRWINTSTKSSFFCVDSSTGAAEWQFGGGGSGASVSLGWDFDNDISSGDPGSGNLRYNDGTLASVTQIFINQETKSGINADELLSNLSNGDKLYIQNEDSTSGALFNVIDDPTDNGSWFTIDVSVGDSIGSVPGDEKEIGVVLIFTGSTSNSANRVQSTCRQDFSSVNKNGTSDVFARKS